MANDCDQGQSLIPIQQVLETLTAQLQPLQQGECVAVDQALNRILQDDVVSSINVPGLDYSAMDGYAFNSDDLASSQKTACLPQSQRIAAGSIGARLKQGSCARIFTGAPIPEGADTVVMQEECCHTEQGIEIPTHIAAGSNVRLCGEDIAKGAVVLSAGQRLGAAQLGLLTSIGVANIPVLRRLKVATFFTGDELQSPGQTLQPGQIYNSNRPMLNALLQQLGCEVIDLGIVPDQLEATQQALHAAREQADLVITSGGVSVGEEDHVRNAVESMGHIELWRLNLRPGKPVVYADLAGTPFVGLPGNPVSVFVTFQIIAMLAVRRLQGENWRGHQYSRVQADFDWQGGKRLEFLRVRLHYDKASPQAELFPQQGSGVLSSASWADGLVVVPENAVISRGDWLDYLPLSIH